MEEKIYGLLDFENEFYYSEDILGSTITTTIYGLEIKLHFPTVSPNIKEEIYQSAFSSNGIVAPNLNINNLDKKINWGRIYSYPNIVAKINHIIIEIPNTEKDYQKIIFTNIESFLNTTFKYCKLISKKIYMTSEKSIKIGGPLELFKYINNDIVKIPNSYNNIGIDIIIPSLDEAISLSTFTLALKNTILTPEIPLEYQLMLNAYCSFENYDFRNTVIEATSALEVLLSHVAKKELEKYNMPKLQQLLEKFKMISGKFELLNLLNVNVPTTDYRDKILKPRNQVVHKGIFIDKKSALSVIHEIEKYLDTFSPLI